MGEDAEGIFIEPLPSSAVFLSMPKSSPRGKSMTNRPTLLAKAACVAAVACSRRRWGEVGIMGGERGDARESNEKIIKSRSIAE